MANRLLQPLGVSLDLVRFATGHPPPRGPRVVSPATPAYSVTYPDLETGLEIVEGLVKGRIPTRPVQGRSAS